MFFDSLVLLAFLFHSLLCIPVYSIPLDARQADNAPLPATRVSVTTVVFPSATCVSTFTPAQDGGKDVIVEVDSCVVQEDPSSPEASSTSITSTTTSSNTLPSTTTTTLTVTLPPASASSPPTSASSSITSASSLTTTSSSPTTSASPPAISSSSEIPSPSSSIISPSDAVNPPLPGDTDTSTILGTSSISVEPSAVGVSGVAAAAAVESTMPGKKLSVLPIGLGVFAGISVIALIVVGLVTYERTKYRKAFRQRKLAEAAAPMGYGGTY